MHTIKLFVAALCIACAAACNQAPSKNTATTSALNQPAANTPEVPANLLIVPGKGIGYIKLNENVDSVENRLKNADRTDGAMGASMLTWFAGHDTSGYRTTIYATRQMGGKDESASRVQLIRITSPQFKTSDGMHVSSPLSSINKKHKLTVNKTPYAGSSGKYYDDVNAGIAFEVDNQKCTAIVVHQPNDSLSTHLNMRQ